MKQKKNKILLLILLIGLIIIMLFTLLNKQRDDYENKLDNKSVSNNLTVNDDIITFLYDRFHLEDGLKFTISGSNIYDKDYAFYYSKDKITFDDFSDIYKSYILLDVINYQDNYVEDKECYSYSLQEFKDAYLKYYGSIDDFNLDTSETFKPYITLNEEEMCISSKENFNSNYTKTIDTYMVNGFYQDDKLIIYERVAFIKLNDNSLEFYSDYKMKNKVYTLNMGAADTSFINNSKKVSNVLINYQDEFPLYQYTYKKVQDTYYFESIIK